MAKRKQGQQLDDLDRAKKLLDLKAAKAKAAREELALQQAQDAASRGGGPYWRRDTELAAQLGISRSYVSKLKLRPWWPKKGKWGWDEALVRRAITENIPNGAALVARPNAKEAKVDAPTRAVLNALATSTDPLEISRCATQLAARRLAAAYRAGLSGGGREASELKHALEEQRRMESDYLDLERKRGTLVLRASLAAASGAIARFMLRALDEVESMIAAQVELWVTEPSFQNATTDERKAIVQDWVRRRSRELREAAADHLDEIVAQAAQEVQ